MKPFLSIISGWLCSLPVVAVLAVTSFAPRYEFFLFLVLITFLISIVIAYPLCVLVERRIRRHGRIPGYKGCALLGGCYGAFTLLLIYIPFFHSAAPIMLIGFYPATIAAAIQGSVAATLIRKHLEELTP